MSLTRRWFLVATVSLPAILAARRAGDVAGDLLAGAVRAARPAAAGTSAGRCAQCGSPGHTMLDPACPLAPRVRA